MRRLLSWWNHERGSPRNGLLRAAIALLWFLTIHPFEDGNGRIARALADRALAEDESAAFPCRLYSLSHDIEEHREAYCEVIEATQAGDGDITDGLSGSFFLSDGLSTEHGRLFDSCC